jgi:hypothetical protein
MHRSPGGKDDNLDAETAQPLISLGSHSWPARTIGHWYGDLGTIQVVRVRV